MIKTGDRVYHKSHSDEFGPGKVLLVNATKGTALVRWDSHQVVRTTAKLATNQSHVRLSSLTGVDSKD